MLALIVTCGSACGFYLYVMIQWWREATLLRKSRTRYATVYLSAKPNLAIVPEQRWLGSEAQTGRGVRARRAGIVSGEVISMDRSKVGKSDKRVVA